MIDNASTDRTVEIAINAGAILAYSFKSKYFNEFEKIAYLNTVVKNYNDQSNENYIWWLYIDADEFPNINCKLRIIDFLGSLDFSIMAVSGYLFDHIPTHPPYNISGCHPADFMQLSVKTNTSKIPLLRYDKGKAHFYSAGGAHTFDTCGESISIALDALDIHHFNYRRPEDTINRLKLFITQSADGTSRVDWLDRREQRYNTNAKSMYHTRYERAKSIYSANQYKILMTDELNYSYNDLVRWYSPDLPVKTDDALLNQAIHYFFLKKYDSALFKFNDLLTIVNDYKMQMLVTVKIALCLYFTDKNESIFLIRPILKCHDAEIRDYAEKQFLRINEDELSVTKESRQIDFVIQSYYSQFAQKNFL
jgi:hypothetical protein